MADSHYEYALMNGHVCAAGPTVDLQVLLEVLHRMQPGHGLVLKSRRITIGGWRTVSDD